MTETADIILIGGVHGASLAFPFSKTKVETGRIEKNFIASGATGRPVAWYACIMT
jgi:hypothetical protein